MKLVCTLCGQITADGNLWCEQLDCPAGDIPIVLSYGEFLGDIKIVRLLRLFRTAAVYEAERNEEMVLLKVAHLGHDESLKQESRLLAELTKANQPTLPTLLPAYLHGSVKDYPYGKAVFREQTRYYEVFEYVQGEFLRDVLLKNPQPWYQHTAWIVTSIAKAIAFLYGKGGGLHLNVSPDVILIHYDKENIPRALLLDLGLIVKPGIVDLELQQRAHQHVLPAYTTPELLEPGSKLTEASDVYGLGLLLYEMLAGHPAFEYRLRSDAEIRDAVLNTMLPPVDRRDLPQADKFLGIVTKATNRNPAQRYARLGEFGKDLVGIFGDVPRPKKSRTTSLAQMSMPVFVLSIVVVLLLILISTLLAPV